MSLIQHRLFPRTMFNYDLWSRPLFESSSHSSSSSSSLGPLTTLDLFDPFDVLDHDLCRNLSWINQPRMLSRDENRVRQKYRITVDCHGYKPSSIKTEIAGGGAKLVVSGRENDEAVKVNNDDGDYSLKEFKRTYRLPKNVETDKMVSFNS